MTGRRPWLAAILSVLIPGLGQVYNRQVGKAALFFLSSTVPLALSSWLGPMLWDAVLYGRGMDPDAPPFGVVLALRGVLILIAFGVIVLAAVDAYHTAARG